MRVSPAPYDAENVKLLMGKAHPTGKRSWRFNVGLPFGQTKSFGDGVGLGVGVALAGPPAGLEVGVGLGVLDGLALALGLVLGLMLGLGLVLGLGLGRVTQVAPRGA